MNRDLWMRVLQIAVVAPYVYHLSSESKSDYFRLGLKLVAGGIVVANLGPLLVQAAPLIRVLADATAQASKTRILSADERADAIDGEYVKES